MQLLNKVLQLANKKDTSISGWYEMTDVKTISSYFIARSSELEENDLTNLKLQKLLYYTQAERYKKHGDTAFGDAIEAWSYGPVVSSVYHWLKECGSYPITAFDIPVDTSNLKPSDKLFLNIIWNQYSKFSANFLVQKTHERNSPWYIAFNKHGKNSEIPLESLRRVSLANEW